MIMMKKSLMSTLREGVIRWRLEPESDGADIGILNTIVQEATPTRTTDYTVPFRAFGGIGAQGLTLNAVDFEEAGAPLVQQLAAACYKSYSPVQVTRLPVETVFCAPPTSSSCAR
jgi:hypothetical protein